VRRLLTDENELLRDRVAGCLILSYAQPLTRILALTTGDPCGDSGISETSASKFYRLAGGEWNRYAAGGVSW
jgi:hypothetical protein